MEIPCLVVRNGMVGGWGVALVSDYNNSARYVPRHRAKQAFCTDSCLILTKLLCPIYTPLCTDDETESGMSRNRPEVTQQMSGGVGFEPFKLWSLNHNFKVTFLRPVPGQLRNQFPSPSQTLQTLLLPHPSPHSAAPSFPFVSVILQIRLI